MTGPIDTKKLAMAVAAIDNAQAALKWIHAGIEGADRTAWLIDDLRRSTVTYIPGRGTTSDGVLAARGAIVATIQENADRIVVDTIDNLKATIADNLSTIRKFIGVDF